MHSVGKWTFDLWSLVSDGCLTRSSIFNPTSLLFWSNQQTAVLGLFSLIISTSCFKQADYTKVSASDACVHTPTHNHFDSDWLLILEFVEMHYLQKSLCTHTHTTLSTLHSKRPNTANSQACGPSAVLTGTTCLGPVECGETCQSWPDLQARSSEKGPIPAICIPQA